MRAPATIVLLALASGASATSLTVEVRTAAGAPVRNAVVSLYPAGRAVPVSPPAAAYEIAQRDLAFSPFVLVVPTGARVAFPNHDSLRHHVYSFSRPKRFELKLYAKEQDRSVVFDKAGVVPLGCNIHDGMTAFVKVADTALAVRTDASGRAVFASAPPGPVTARVWHPFLRAPGNETKLEWSLPRSGPASKSVSVNLRSPPIKPTY